MGNRNPTKVSAIIRAFLIKMQGGEYCAIDGLEPTEENPLQIDHIDSNPGNNDPGNLRLVHFKCNLALRDSARVSVKENMFENTKRVKERVDYQQGSTEMRVNEHCEETWRLWVNQQIEDNGVCYVDDAVNAGALVAGCSIATTARYLKKYTSAASPWEKVKDGDLRGVIRMRPQRVNQYARIEHDVPLANGKSSTWVTCVCGHRNLFKKWAWAGNGKATCKGCKVAIRYPDGLVVAATSANERNEQGGIV